jgi:hypothetical protein
LAATVSLVVVAWLAPGDFVVWHPLRAFFVIVLVAQAAWVAWTSPSLAIRGFLVMCGALLALVQWGIPAASRGMCGQETLATLRSAGATLELVRSDCGATTADLREVFLTRGTGLFRRRQVLVHAYMYPDIELLNLDHRTIRMRLRFSAPTDSIAILEIPTNDPGPTRSYYRGIPSE